MSTCSGMSSLEQGSENQLVDSDVAEENAKLFDEFIELLGREDRTKAEVVMVIGKSGAGKSAFINTIHKVLTRKYFQIAKQGSGTAQSVAPELVRYDNCGISLETIKDEERKQTLERVMDKLPHLIDCAGLGDVDTPELREILEMLIGGFIPPHTQIEALQSQQKKFGVGCLKIHYPKATPEWRVTKVVFLQSCRVDVPKNLISCLNGVLKITDPSTFQRKYTAELFLLITKYDLVRDATVQLSNTTDDKCMTLEEFVKVENEIATEFNIVGALESNRIRWASFTDSIQGEDQYIDNFALKFLKRMVEPGPPSPVQAEPVVGVIKILQLYMFKLTNQIKQYLLQDMQLNLTPASFALAVLFVVVIAVLYKLLSAGV